MHLGETLLVLGALVIFSMATLHLNDSKLENDIKIMETEFKTTAIGIAQSFIEEAQALEFDEVLHDTSFTGFVGTVPGGFTAPASLGPETGETFFDDVDDFNGYSANINTPRADYNVNITVSYADSVTVTPGFANKSFLKVMVININSAFFSDSLKLDYVHSFR